jgi:V8-like Glu-specific endopeptidase
MAGAGLGAGVNKEEVRNETGANEAATTTPTQRQRSWSDALATPLRSLVAAASLFSASEEQLKGGIYPDGTDGSLQLALGKRLSGPITPDGGGTVAVKISYSDTNSPTGRYAVYCSGTILGKKTILSAAHCFLNRPNLIAEVRTGSNFRTDPGTIHRVSKVSVDPLFLKDSDRDSKIDLAVLELSDPIDTLDAKLPDSRPPVGSRVVLAGFGSDGTPSIGYRKQDGLARAGTSEVDQGVAVIVSGQSPEYYVGTYFSNSSAKPGELRSAPGDSGGPVFVVDQQDRVVSLAGMVVAGSNSVLGSFSYFLDFSNPEVRRFIDAHTTNTEPQLPKLFISQRNEGLLISWPVTPNVTLQIAPAPQGPWTASTTDPTTNSGTSSVFIYSQQLESAGFFRLTKSQ